MGNRDRSWLRCRFHDRAVLLMSGNSMFGVIDMENLIVISRRLSAGLLSQSLSLKSERPMSSQNWSPTSTAKTPMTPYPAFLTRKASSFFTTWRKRWARRSGTNSFLMCIFLPSAQFLYCARSDLGPCPILVFHILCSQIP